MSTTKVSCTLLDLASSHTSTIQQHSFTTVLKLELQEVTHPITFLLYEADICRASSFTMSIPRSQSKAVPALLALPAELRAAIYDFVLGGHIIHIGYPGSGHPRRPSLCRASEIDGRGLTEPSQMLVNRHSNCYLPISVLIRFDILFVCRQIYREAKHAVFQTNIFTFSNPLAMTIFADCLTDFQRNAVTTIMLYDAHRKERWTSRTSETAKFLPLPGIRHLRIFFELCNADFVPSSGESLREIHTQDRRLSCSTMFKSPSLKRVELIVSDKTRDLLDDRIVPLSITKVQA